MKKFLSLFLALMMLSLSVFAAAEDSVGVIGSADGPTAILTSEIPLDRQQAALDAGRRVESVLTITDISGIESKEEYVPALIDMLKSLSLSWGAQGEEFDGALRIGGTDVLTLGAAQADKDTYVQSNLIGGTVVVGADEILPLMERLVDMFVLMEAATQEDADAVKEQLPEIIEMVKAEVGGASLTAEDLLAMDFSAFEPAMEGIKANIKTLDSLVVPRNCDPAVSGYSVTITDANMKALMKAMVHFVEANPDFKAQLQANGDYVTEEERAEMWAYYKDLGIYESEEEFREYYPTLDETINLILTEVDNETILAADVTVLVYLDAENLPVYAVLTIPTVEEVVAEMNEVTEDGTKVEKDPETVVSETMTMTFSRQTVAAGVSLVINVMSDKSADAATLDMLVKENALSAKFDILSEAESDEDIFMTLEAAWDITEAAENVKVDMTISNAPWAVGEPAPEMGWAVAVTYETNTVISGVDYTSNDKVTVNANGVNVVLEVKSATTEPKASIMSGDVVRPAEMTEGDFMNWFVGVINGLQGVLMNVMMALPEDLLVFLLG